MSIASISGTVWPNGEFTIGAAPRRIKREDVAPSTARYSDEEEWRALALRVHGLDDCLEGLPPADPLSSTSVPIRHKRKKKGLKGISGYGRRMVRNGCFMIDRDRDRHKIGFATMTLPQLSAADHSSVVAEWSRVVRTFIQFIKRRLDAKGVIPHILYVTEIQEKRYERTGTPYPHLHFCYPCRSVFNYQWFITASEMRVAWDRAVSAVCAERYDFGASCHCVVVKKSVGRYLSKYLSKGARGRSEALAERLPVEITGHWWGISKPLRQAICGAKKQAGCLAEWLWSGLDRLREIGAVAWVVHVWYESPGYGSRCLGCCGVLAEGFRDMLDGIYSSCRSSA